MNMHMLNTGGVNLVALRTMLAEQVQSQVSHLGTRRSGTTMPAQKAPRSSTVIGVLGPRGSGKTYALTHWATTGAAGPFLALPPIDCSLSPEGQSLTLTVLHGIRRALRGLLGPNLKSADLQAADHAFDRVCHGVLSSDESSHQVLLGTCTTPSQYAEQSARIVARRLDLPADTASWLDTEVALFKSAGHKVEGFIVAVDDVDLVPPTNERDFVHALLDELHQDRLVFLLAADPTVLVQNLHAHKAPTDSGFEVSKELARALLYKLMPGSRRVYAAPWRAAERGAFRPLGAMEGSSIASLIRHDTFSRASRDRPSAVEEHLSRLLPPWARGLEDAYRMFERGAQENSHLTADEVLPFLAEARGEPELAHELRQRPPARWAQLLDWDDIDLGGPPWASLVARSGGDLDDLPELRPPIQPVDRGGAGAPEAGGNLGLLDAPVWVEVLLDLAFECGVVTPSWWIGAYTPVRRRLREARWRLTLPVRGWDELFVRQDARSLAWLHWVQPVGSAEAPELSVDTNVGWHPFADFLLDARDLVPEVVAKLGIGSIGVLREAEDALPEPLRTRGLASRGLPDAQRPLVLPERVRALIALAGSLGSVPWKEMAADARTTRSIRFFAGLAAGVTWAALVRAIGVERLGLRGDLPFLDSLRGPRAIELMALEEDELVALLARIPVEAPALMKDPAPPIAARELHRCLVDLHAHPAFTLTVRG